VPWKSFRLEMRAAPQAFAASRTQSVRDVGWNVGAI
jgi:hypothetical protein